ncbi:Hypothetical protein CAP_6596 [Chondromyces apiculatus DSM 436]|uniref:Uncharacterized protein n=1 Tax=Chondromyces apiculatus DSM 436 TaxID=1192034 RepID=A0A017T2D4_9BACT|nr:Hypothetical protein CAP_6596 [Chondromyces apiculatus DSM 436]
MVRIELRQGARPFRGWMMAAALSTFAAAVVGVGLWLGAGAMADGNGRGGGSRGHEARATGRGDTRTAKGSGAEAGEAAPRGRAGTLAGRGTPGGKGAPGDGSGQMERGDVNEDGEATAAANPGAVEAEGPSGAPEERTGLRAFPPHGTKRIKEGIVVPEDFPLPPGYVRHYQATDRGQMLEPILMFHPDHRPVDAQGNPIPLPEDRVVPPEMVPEGLQVEMLEVPEGAYAGPEDQQPGNGPESGEGNSGDGEADPAP